MSLCKHDRPYADEYTCDHCAQEMLDELRAKLEAAERRESLLREKLTDREKALEAANNRWASAELELTERNEAYSTYVVELRDKLEAAEAREAETARLFNLADTLSGMTLRQRDKAKATASKLAYHLEAAIAVLNCVRFFVTSRKRINHPVGEEWFNECMSKCEETLAEYRKS